MVKDTCLALLLATTQSLVLQDLEGYRRLERLKNNNRKQVIQRINKKVYQTIPKY
jgi:hypothetical protein